jgi:Mrp family chromosome partitioning ATPase
MKRIQQALELSRREPVVVPPQAELPAQTELPPPQVEIAARVQPRARAAVEIRRRQTPRTISQDTRNRNRLKLGTESDATAEAYRVVRTRVLQWLDTNGRSTVAMVSAAPDEGKTLSAVNLAFSMAQDTNHTVLLVDLDLRSPSIHRTLELDVPRGLESYFRNEAPLEDLIVPVGSSRLAVLPCLEPIAGSSELLGGSVVGNLVEELRQRYADRVVLFDLPPALMGDDALVFLPLIDAALLVIGDGRTRKDHLAELAELLGDVPVIGSLLNRVKVHPMQSHYR